jgi:chemotaxis protein MotA
MQGYAPQVSIEFARKILTSDVRPSFAELEEQIQNIPAD